MLHMKSLVPSAKRRSANAVIVVPEYFQSPAILRIRWADAADSSARSFNQRGQGHLGYLTFSPPEKLTLRDAGSWPCEQIFHQPLVGQTPITWLFPQARLCPSRRFEMKSSLTLHISSHMGPWRCLAQRIRFGLPTRGENIGIFAPRLGNQRRPLKFAGLREKILHIGITICFTCTVTRRYGESRPIG